MTTPRVAVIMPIFDQAWVAHRAVQALARQTFKDFEFVVVDDGSTDGLDAQALAQAAGVENYASARRAEPGGSAALAINAGVELTSAPLITWISGDNLMAPLWLEMLVDKVDAGAGAAYGGFTFIPARRQDVETFCADERLSIEAVAAHWSQRFRSRYIFVPHAPGKQIQSEACYYGPAHLARREVWTDHEGGASHDLGWWLRCEEECERRGWPIVGVNHDLCLYLAHDERCVVRQPDKYDSKEQLRAARERRG